MNLRILQNGDEFRAENHQIWQSCWKYWFEKQYVHHGIREYLGKELAAIKNEKGSVNLLDLGCGSAWAARFYHKVVDSYVGVDFNTSLINTLTDEFQSAPRIKFVEHDLESRESLPVSKKEFKTVLASFVALELADLKSLFRQVTNLQSNGDYFLLIGLDPIHELIRASLSPDDVINNLAMYRRAKKPVILTKTMSFNGSGSSFLYNRVLYSISDVLTASRFHGYEVVTVDDQVNRNSEQINAPIYYFIKLRRVC